MKKYIAHIVRFSLHVHVHYVMHTTHWYKTKQDITVGHLSKIQQALAVLQWLVGFGASPGVLLNPAWRKYVPVSAEGTTFLDCTRLPVPSPAPLTVLEPCCKEPLHLIPVSLSPHSHDRTCRAPNVKRKSCFLRAQNYLLWWTSDEESTICSLGRVVPPKWTWWTDLGQRGATSYLVSPFLCSSDGGYTNWPSWGQGQKMSLT